MAFQTFSLKEINISSNIDDTIFQVTKKAKRNLHKAIGIVGKIENRDFINCCKIKIKSRGVYTRLQSASALWRQIYTHFQNFQDIGKWCVGHTGTNFLLEN